MDNLDRQLINSLQQGIALCENPYAALAQELCTTQETIVERIGELLARGLLSRFGPLYDAERLGGGLTLCAMSVPDARFDAVADYVNSFSEVAHNYARDHALNMWFVLASERRERIAQVIDEIERRTGSTVFNMPKLEEFFIGLHLEV